MSPSDATPFNASKITAGIVAAYVVKNSLQIADLPVLIHSVHTALTQLASGLGNSAPQAEKQEPAVAIRKSITPDYLVCLEDGRDSIAAPPFGDTRPDAGSIPRQMEPAV